MGLTNIDTYLKGVFERYLQDAYHKRYVLFLYLPIIGSYPAIF